MSVTPETEVERLVLDHAAALDPDHEVIEIDPVRKLSFAAPELVRELTGMEIGGGSRRSRRLKLHVAPEAFVRMGAEVVEDLAMPLG